MEKKLKFCVIGNGSWATALVKILTDNGSAINWWMRNTKQADYMIARRHNPHYLSSAYFNSSLLYISGDLNEVLQDSDVIVMAVPSAYIQEVLTGTDPAQLKGKKI